MLKDAHVAVTIPSQDLKRARQFYADKLGLTPAEETPAGLEYKVGDGSGFLLFQSSGKASGAHTQMAFDVDDVRAEVKNLRARGLSFEEYDFPGFKTVDGVADTGGSPTAWFKDSEGNLIAIGQRVRVGAGR
jgi:catechol 2,3-dioxygenase-like lactoylglutathione lyase family enzyme